MLRGHPVLLEQLEIPNSVFESQELAKVNDWLLAQLDRLRAKIRRNVNYWFNPVNLQHDAFLKAKLKAFTKELEGCKELEGGNGLREQCIPLTILMRFNSIRYSTANPEFILRAINAPSDFYRVANFNKPEELELDPNRVLIYTVAQPAICPEPAMRNEKPMSSGEPEQASVRGRPKTESDVRLVPAKVKLRASLSTAGKPADPVSVSVSAPSANPLLDDDSETVSLRDGDQTMAVDPLNTAMAGTATVDTVTVDTVTVDTVTVDTVTVDTDTRPAVVGTVVVGTGAGDSDSCRDVDGSDHKPVTTLPALDASRSTQNTSAQVQGEPAKEDSLSKDMVNNVDKDGEQCVEICMTVQLDHPSTPIETRKGDSDDKSATEADRSSGTGKSGKTNESSEGGSERGNSKIEGGAGKNGDSKRSVGAIGRCPMASSVITIL
ncbi:hypothetical protein GNI_083750 [Gregarina niphandrodes]|uniref:HTH La-type RNA-binding domain-containing protein n=1 Tax=Gregarina niphandrodes TaxID=110365 RepID=A0A023B6D0_GRENI|nr:hypothetical protein GNI_083750 [Gregarina niphandrodes]EZG65383.1 hypothetical protein GNI_083750 [Gregarina niphandrodes]|eukprot:XP_011134088.1 hypothetical protein GNI_083750 [Gregarina niphandrodes]